MALSDPTNHGFTFNASKEVCWSSGTDTPTEAGFIGGATFGFDVDADFTREGAENSETIGASSWICEVFLRFREFGESRESDSEPELSDESSLDMDPSDELDNSFWLDNPCFSSARGWLACSVFGIACFVVIV